MVSYILLDEEYTIKLSESYALVVDGRLRGVYQHVIVRDPTEVELNEHQARFVRVECTDGTFILPIFRALSYDAIAAFSAKPSKHESIVTCPVIYVEVMYLTYVPFCRKNNTEPYYVIGKTILPNYTIK